MSCLEFGEDSKRVLLKLTFQLRELHCLRASSILGIADVVEILVELRAVVDG